MPRIGFCCWSAFTLLHVPWCHACMGSQTSWRALTDELCQQWDGSSSSGSSPSTLLRWSYRASSVRRALPILAVRCLPPVHRCGSNRLLTGVHGAYMKLSENLWKMMADAWDAWGLRSLPHCWPVTKSCWNILTRCSLCHDSQQALAGPGVPHSKTNNNSR